VTQSTLQNRYEIESFDLGYQFVTETGIIYFITFIEYPTISDFLSTKIYMFNIEHTTPKEHIHYKYDNRVRNTVIFILETFFSNHEDALITIYDFSDGRQLCRKRLFDSWFKLFNNGKLCKLEAKCLIDEQLTYTSLLYNKKHYDDKYLKEEFQELIDANFYN